LNRYSSTLCFLIIFYFLLEVSLGVCANGAKLGSGLTYVYVAAVGAEPYANVLGNEDLLGLELLKNCSVTSLMLLLDSGYHIEQQCDLGEALLAGILCEACVHIGPLVVLACSSVCQVGSGIGNAAVMEQLEPDLCVLLLVLCGLCTSVMWGAIFNLAVEGLGAKSAAASGLFMTMVIGGGILPLLQGAIADATSYMISYWLPVAALAYICWFALLGSKVKKA
jgi:hypothetical protein